MLCILPGKEKIKDASGLVVSCGRDATCIQADIHSQIGSCEHGQEIQHRKEGRCVLGIKKETIQEATLRIKKDHADKHLPFDASTVVDSDLEVSVISEAISPLKRDVFIDPALRKADGSPVLLDDFPDGHSFGNGVTANSLVKLKDGTKLFLTWCIFPAGTTLDKVQKQKLCLICES